MQKAHLKQVGFNVEAYLCPSILEAYRYQTAKYGPRDKLFPGDQNLAALKNHIIAALPGIRAENQCVSLSSGIISLPLALFGRINLPRIDLHKKSDTLLRRAIADLPIVANGIVLRISASIAVASHEGEIRSMSAIQQNADQAMYEAKAPGRNRVSAFLG